MSGEFIEKQVHTLINEFQIDKEKCFDEISRVAVNRGYLEQEFYNEISMFGLLQEDMGVLIKKFRKFKSN